MIDIKKLAEYKNYRTLCKKVYEESFPSYERWDFDRLMEMEGKSPFSIYAIVDTNLSPVGIYVPWTLSDFIYVEFLAIDKSCRGKNYGSIFLKHILDLETKNIVIEVEPSNVSEMAKKRIEWYKRFGFIMSENTYFMPSLDDIKSGKKVEMKIMTTKPITDIEFANIVSILHRDVYEI